MRWWTDLLNPTRIMDDDGNFIGKARRREDAAIMAASAELQEALIEALPYVESEENNDAYKPGKVKAVVARMRAAIDKSEGEKANG